MIEWVSWEWLGQIAESSQTYFSNHTFYGILLAFGIALIESIAIIGSLVPGIITMTFVGFLIGSGAIPTYPALTAIFFGALLGDYISYWVGKYFRPQITQSKFYQKRQSTFAYGEGLLNKNAIKGIIIGRILGPVRSTIPLIAGLIALPLRPFLIGATGSVIVWSFCYLTPGILIGLLSEDFTSPLMQELPMNMINWLAHLFLSFTLIYLFMQERKKRLQNPDQIIYTLRECAALTALFIYTCSLVILGSDVLIINDILLFAMQSLQHYSTIYAACFLSIIADKYTLYGFCLLASIYLLLRGQYWSFILFSFATFGVGFAIKFVKVMVAYPRPEIMINLLGPTAFPSGHVGLYYTTVLALAAMFSHSFPRYKTTAFRIAHLSNILVALSRVYLQAHWLTDIVGGVIIGYLFYLAPYALVSCRRLQFDHTPAVSIHLAGLFAALALIVPLSRLHIPTLTYHYNPHYYLIENRTHLLSKAQWQQTDSDMLTYAQNSFGISQYPLNIHLNMQLQKLENYLQANDWHAHQGSALPLSAHFLSKKPDHVFVQSKGQRLRFLILWEKDHILDDDQPLLVGILMEKSQDDDSSNSLLSFQDFNTVDDLEIPNTHKLTHNIDGAIPFALRLKHWNGHVVKIYE